MNMLDRAIAAVWPRRGLERARARAAMMHYAAAAPGERATAWRAAATDADAAARQRARLAFIARDLVRNTPHAARAQAVIAANVVGDGIIPKVTGFPAGSADLLRAEAQRLIEAHFDTTAADADGRQNLYGLQRLVINTVVDAGEALVVRVHPSGAGFRGPGLSQLQVLEPDYLDDGKDGRAAGGTEGEIREGIEYDGAGRRAAYHLFDEHPGGTGFRGRGWRGASRRVPAADVCHVYRQDRAGQQRGVSWFAATALALQDLGDYQDAQIMRQKIAACFAGFRKLGDTSKAPVASLGATLSPGLIQDIGPDEDIVFADPPEVAGYEEFTRGQYRAIAAALGITYEALTGDLSNVNFTSFKAGRMEMDRQVSAWQWLMLVPQMLQPVARWFLEDWAAMRPAQAAAIAGLRVEWTPPHRFLVDPAREIPAMVAAIRGGLTSLQATQRQLGQDPERLIEEIAEDKAAADRLGLTFDSNPGSDAARMQPADADPDP